MKRLHLCSPRASGFRMGLEAATVNFPRQAQYGLAFPKVKQRLLEAAVSRALLRGKLSDLNDPYAIHTSRTH
jgi:hypothetical protein